MNTHVAILKKPYIDAILAGTKTVESRFMRTRRAPLGLVAAGDQVYLKQSGGHIRAAACARWVAVFDQQDDPGWRRLRREHAEAIGAPSSYWREVRGRRWAMLVGLAGVRSVIAGPSIEHWTNRRSAWLVIPASDVRAA